MALSGIVIPGYTLVSVICQSEEFLVYRALTPEKQQILLKVPASSPPRLQQLLSWSMNTKRRVNWTPPLR